MRMIGHLEHILLRVKKGAQRVMPLRAQFVNGTPLPALLKISTAGHVTMVNIHMVGEILGNLALILWKEL